MEYTYNDKSLAKHHVLRLDVREVLAIANSSTHEFDMPLAKNGNLRIMFVGYNVAGRLLEIGVEFIDENNAHVFHGQSISPYYRKLYEEQK